MPFPARLLLHFGHPEQQCRDHFADGALEIEFLSHRHKPQAPVEPIAQHVDTVSHRPAESVELPDDDRFHFPGEHVPLESLEIGALERIAGFFVEIPFRIVDAVALAPALNLSALAGLVLPDRRDSNVDCDTHGNLPVIGDS